METRERTRFDARGLIVDGKPLPFYAGAMHYWRVEPARWAACLRAVHQLGLTIVETYVPWRVHEPERGEYEWDGPRDLGRFLELARAEGLGVVLRPGPHVNAELTCFGMPDHVVGDPAIQARTARGTPVWMPSPPRAWPVPSYASKEFRERVRAWYAAVAAIVMPHLAPDGPVVALGVDNEAQLFFRLGAFDHDYHPDAIARFGREPPRDASDPAKAIAWVQFKERYIADALGAFATMFDEVGLGGIARFHNLPPGHHAYYDVRGLAAAIGGPVGIDAYTARGEFRELRRRASALVGAAETPIAFEVGVGFFPWFPPLDRGDDPQRERDQLLTLLAAGVRGFNIFMAVERDRYYGAAIGGDGKIESHASWIATLTATLAEVDWPGLRRAGSIDPAGPPSGAQRSPMVAVIATRADLRFGLTTSTIDPMTPVVLEAMGLPASDFGTDAGAIAARKWQTAILDALELAQVPYTLLDEGAPEAELARYRAVIVPTHDRVDHALWTRLRAVADAKRTVIVIGPSVPTRDEFDRPLAEPAPKRIGKLKAGSLDDLPGLANDLLGLAGDLAIPTIERPDHVRAFAFADAGNAMRVIFLANDAAKPANAVLLVEAASLRDPFTRESFRVAAGKVSIAVPPLGVRLLVVGTK